MVSTEVKKAILNQKLTIYQNTVYDISLDVKIAKVLENKEQEEASVARMKPVMKALELLESELSELE